MKTAEDDGAKGLFVALFNTKPKAKRATKQPKDKPSASLPSSPPPA